jgi:hypothetical protein
MRIINAIEQLGAVAADRVDRPADRPEAQHVVGRRPHRRRRAALSLVQPERPVGGLEDHRHALMQLGHRCRAECDRREGELASAGARGKVGISGQSQPAGVRHWLKTRRPGLPIHQLGPGHCHVTSGQTA